jgi:hypothetical protein
MSLTRSAFPSYPGGLMPHADMVGLYSGPSIARFAANPHGDLNLWQLAPLLAKLARKARPSPGSRRRPPQRLESSRS